MKIQDLMRISSVKRWHIVATAKEQTLADHTCRVAILAYEIAMRLGYIHEWGEEGDILLTALTHDTDEIMNGDTPGNTKNSIEDEVLPKTTTEMVVKLADVLETYLFIQQYHVDRHGKQVAHWCAKRWTNLISQLPDRDNKKMIELENELFVGEYTDA